MAKQKLEDINTLEDVEIEYFNVKLNIIDLLSLIPDDAIIGRSFRAAAEYAFTEKRDGIKENDFSGQLMFKMFERWINESKQAMWDAKKNGRQGGLTPPKGGLTTGIGGPTIIKEKKKKEEKEEKEENTTPLPPPRGTGGGGGDDGDLLKLLEEFSPLNKEQISGEAVKYVYDVVAVGEHITSRYAYARKILTDIINDRSSLFPIFFVDQVKEFLAERSPKPGNKPKKPMDSRTVTDEEMNDVYADIMNRPRSV